MPYRFGSTLDGRNVSTISWCRSLGAYVLLRPPGGQRCFLAQNMPPRAAPAAPAAPVAAASTPSEGGALGGVLEGIERVSPNEFNVRRSTVDRILESQAGEALLGKMGRAATTRNWATTLKLQALASAA